MSSFLRLSLILMSVGGGFTGVAVCCEALLSPANHVPVTLGLLGIFLLLFLYVTIGGLMFVHDPRRTRPLVVALCLQLFWIVSPVVTYKFVAGFEVAAAVFFHGLGKGSALQLGYEWAARLGSVFQFFLLRDQRLGGGVNFAALALLIFLLRARRRERRMLAAAELDAAGVDGNKAARSSVEPTGSAPSETAPG